jgi:AraC-like DNA-binding protein
MVSSRALRLAPITNDDLLAGVRARARTLAASEGHTMYGASGICMYTYSQPTPVTKLTSHGVVLCMVLQGQKRVTVDGETMEFDPGEMIVVTRDIEVQVLATNQSPERPYVALSLSFDPERVARALLALADLPPSGDAAPVTAFSREADVPFVSALERLLDTLADPLDRTTIAPLILDEILFRLLRTDAAAAVRASIGTPQDARRIIDVMQFIRANHTQKLTVTGLARHAAMSPSHFAHRFSSVARLSPMKYLREVRLDRARALLGADGVRPSEVAALVGFESAAHFAREFKRRFGVPPSQYRERVVIA